MFRKGTSIPVDSIGKFDLIVHPEDAAPHPPTEIEHGVQVKMVPPMTLIDTDEMWGRDAARRRLGVPLDARVAYVQLGAGRINEIDSDVRQVVDALLSHEEVHVVLGESLLGDRLQINLERVHLIRDYPNALFFNAFDVSVQAGGYNSFHEMRCLGMPTLFIPNMNTGMDDQYSRCMVAETEGWGLVHDSKTEINDSIMKLINHKSSIKKFESNGSEVLSKYLIGG
jgi:UDP:flavonoid glycosyltransferase YjiC (YdhE family)